MSKIKSILETVEMYFMFLSMKSTVKDCFNLYKRIISRAENNIDCLHKCRINLQEATDFAIQYGDTKYIKSFLKGILSFEQNISFYQSMIKNPTGKEFFKFLDKEEYAFLLIRANDILEFDSTV